MNSFTSFIMKKNVLLSKFNYIQPYWCLLLGLAPYLQITSFYCLYCDFWILQSFSTLLSWLEVKDVYFELQK